MTQISKKFTAASVRKFCADCYDLRLYMQSPAIVGDRVVATNGHCLLSVPIDECEEIPEQWLNNKALSEAVMNSSIALYKSMLKQFEASLPEKPDCRHCRGAGIAKAEDEWGVPMEACYLCRGSGKAHFFAHESIYTRVYDFPLSVNSLADAVEFLGEDLAVAIPEKRVDEEEIVGPIYLSSKNTKACAIIMGVRVFANSKYVRCGREIAV